VRRYHPLAAGALLLLSACKVERTAPGFYQHRTPAATEQEQAEGEIRTRVVAFRQALGRGNRAAAAAALSPAAEANVIGPMGDDEAALSGGAGLEKALEETRTEGPVLARTPDLQVRVNLREGQGWFATHLELIPADQPITRADRLRMSGVFARDRGEWHLVQLHLSRPTEAPQPADTARADSAAARGDSATAPRDSSSRNPRRERAKRAPGG
jgi:hypothetical protein